MVHFFTYKDHWFPNITVLVSIPFMFQFCNSDLHGEFSVFTVLYLLHAKVQEFKLYACVGRSGDTIRSISHQSKAKVTVERIEQHNLSDVTQILLKGTPLSVETAKVRFNFMKSTCRYLLVMR